MAIWQRFNPRERLIATGAGLVILGWIISLTSYGIGAGTLALLLAIAALVVLYLKYAPNTNINWPAPVSLILIALSGLVGLLVLLDLLSELRVIGFFGITAILALGLEVVGAALMVWGAWQEYQVEKPAMPNFSGGTRTGTGGTSTTPPPAPPAAPMSPPPPVAPPASDMDDRPPA
jgi:hypothetical protein